MHSGKEAMLQPYRHLLLLIGLLPFCSPEHLFAGSP